MTPQPLRSVYPGDDADPVGLEKLDQPERLLRLFVSLPAYAETERDRVGEALATLNATFAAIVRVEPFGPGIGNTVSDDAAPGAADCDAVIAVLRPRLPDDPETAEQAGARGGAAGLVSAMDKRGEAGLPDVYIFRYAESPEQAASDTDWQSGKRAFDSWFRARGGQVLAFDDFSSSGAFAERLDERLKDWLTRLGFEPPPVAEVIEFEPEIVEEPVAALIAEIMAEALVEAPVVEVADLDAGQDVLPEIEAAETVDAPILEEPEAVPAERDAEPAFSKPIPLSDEASEGVRRARFRRLTNFLNRREASFTPVEVPIEPVEADEPAALEAAPEIEPAVAEPETAEFVEPVTAPEEPEAAPEIPAEDAGEAVEEASAEPELEPAAEITEAPAEAPLEPEETPEAFVADAEPETADELDAASAESEPEEAQDTETAGEPVLDTLEHIDEAVTPEPEHLAVEAAGAAPYEILSPLPSAKVIPLRPEREPVIDRVVVPGRWRRRAVLLAMTALTAASIGVAVYAGLQARNAMSRADRAQQGLAEAVDTAGNLLFSLTQESRTVGGAINESSRAILEQAQKLHGELLTAGAFNPTEVFAQANTKKNEAQALYGQNKQADALKSAIESQRLFLALTDAVPGRADWQNHLGASDVMLGDFLVAQNDLVQALGAFRDAVTVYKALSLKDPDGVEIRRLLSVAQQKVGDVLVAKGRLDDGLATYRDAVAIRKTLAQRDANNADRQRDLLEIDTKLADVLSAQNHLDDALAVYREALAIASKTSLMNPADPRWRAAASLTDNKIGDVLVGKERIDDALAAYREGLATIKDVAANDPNNSEWQSVIATTHERIGDAFVSESHFESALASYRDALAIVQALSAKEPANPSWRHGLSETQLRIGSVLFNQNNIDGALAAHRDSLNIMKALAAEDPGNARYQHDLMMDNNDIGLLMNQKGAHADALAAYRDAKAIAVAMATKEPGNTDWQTTRAMIDNNMGALLIDQGSRDEAIAAYRDGLDASKGLVARDPRSVEWQTGLAIAMYNLGEAGEDSEANFTQARDLLRRLDTAGVLRPDKRALIAKVDEAIAKRDGGGRSGRHR